MDRIIIFDTTLRDGEQSPGAAMNTAEKVRIAQQLERLGVDVIEAGFPISSPGDFEGVRAVAKVVTKPQVAALARCTEGDVDRAWEAIKDAKSPRIHVFLATSDIHIVHKLRKDRDWVLDKAARMVAYAKGYTDNVEFSAEDASRSDLAFLAKVVERVIEAGATTVNVPDTVGYALPAEHAEMIGYLLANVPNIGRVRLSVHCHNDLGLGVANSLAAVMAGARQVECTINGIGERAGNTSLEEFVMALRTRHGALGLDTGIQTEQIYTTSRLVSLVTGIVVQPNKAVVGANAFAHEAGIHQDGVLKERSTYEIMTPESIGIRKSSLVLGKHSGRHAFRERLTEMGYTLSEEDLNQVFQRFKELADKKKQVFDEDIEAIVADEVLRIPDKYKLRYLNVCTGTLTVPTATVRIEVDGQVEEVVVGTGVGPIDATFNAIGQITKVRGKLLQFQVSAITGGMDAQGEVSLRLEEDGRVVTGQGADPDIILAAAKAYINALNRLHYMREHPRRVVSNLCSQ
jgi:2-isopropylmalate synthase